MYYRIAIPLLAALISLASSAQTWQPAGAQPMPTGAVSYFALQNCPAGWVEANGAPISQSAFPALYAALGSNLPDLRGEFIRGWDRGRGVDPGRTLGSYQADEIRSHTHGLGTTATAMTGAVPVITGSGSGAISTTAAGATETRPRNMALLVCIKT